MHTVLSLYVDLSLSLLHNVISSLSPTQSPSRQQRPPRGRPITPIRNHCCPDGQCHYNPTSNYSIALTLQPWQLSRYSDQDAGRTSDRDRIFSRPALVAAQPPVKWLPAALLPRYVKHPWGGDKGLHLVPKSSACKDTPPLPIRLH